MKIEQLASRSALSGLAWEKARWADGRRVILGGTNEDEAWVMPSTLTRQEDRRHRDELRLRYSWEEIALRLMAPLPIFGPYEP